MQPDPSTYIQVFWPTLAEMSNFAKYIEYIESNDGHRGGLAKIVAPADWVPRKSGYDNLDEYPIKKPIKQKAIGDNGQYQIQNEVTGNHTFKSFKKLSRKSDYQTPSNCSDDDLEQLYWLGWESRKTSPIYGADMEGTLTDPDVKEFNLNSLDSILNELSAEGHRISGVNTAYLYFGLWRSSFTMHTEDCDLYSINYLHFGAPKAWYSVPPEYGKKLEFLARALFPNLARKCPAFLRHKTTVISPEILKCNGIPYNRVVQRPGEFIITFPYAYHFGFNHGLNCAEATNFALPRWINFGKTASRCWCRNDMVTINMDSFVKKYQPDLYDRWLSQEYIGPDPKESPTSNSDSGDSGIEEKYKEDDKCSTSLKRTGPSFNIKNFVNQKKKRLDAISTYEAPNDSQTEKEELEEIEEVQDEEEEESTTESFENLKKSIFQFLPYSFENEQTYNRKLSLFDPFCSICVAFKYSAIFNKYDMSKLEMEVPERFKIYVPPELYRNKLFVELNVENNDLLVCKSCNVCVHRACYGYSGDSFEYCEKCSIEEYEASCCLCPIRGGALRRTVCGTQWAHVTCGLLLTNVSFINLMVDNTNLPTFRRNKNKTCCYCSKLFYTNMFSSHIDGYTTECKKCSISYHVSCAINQGVFFLQGVNGESYCSDCYEDFKKSCSMPRIDCNPELEEIVIGKIDIFYSYGRVKSIQHDKFHNVSLVGGKENLIREDQLVKNDRSSSLSYNQMVEVLYKNELVFGNYRGDVILQTFTLRFDTGRETIVRREDLYLLTENLPKRVRDKFIESTEALTH